ncbi:MAG: AsnC family transcriptional regulator, partial [Acidimicrobiaceae bacterium]|nr:AsnC family transcriptional regulator [Acidimicrobiaceae bacterium]
MSDRFVLDDVDRVLIGELIADGRATYAKLAPVVGLSQAATRARVQRLLDERIVVVTGRVDPATFGLGVFAFAFLEVDGEVDKTAALIAEIDEFKGRWEALANLAPERLSVLRRIATIESVGSSTRIEGVKLRDDEIGRLLSGLDVSALHSRDEQEVVGYAELMELIFESCAGIRFT